MGKRILKRMPDKGNEMIQINWKKSIRTKQLVLFAIFLTINVIFSIMLYYNATSSVKKSIYDKMNAQANFYLDTLDNNLNNTETMLYDLFSDRKLVFLVHPTNLLNDYELRDAYLAQQERIMSVKNSNPLISTGIIYLPNIGKKISDISIEEMTAQDYELVEQKYPLIDNIVNSEEGSLFMVSAGGPYNNKVDIPDVLFMVEFSEKRLQDTLHNFNTVDHSGSFLYHGGLDVFIESSEDEAVSIGILDKILPDLERNDIISSSDTISLNGVRYQISISWSDYFGYYVQYVPEKEILKDIDHYIWLLLIYIVGVTVVALILSKVIERIVHKPLNKLMVAFSSVEKDNLSSGVTEYGENEFSYLFEGFNQMQEKTKNLIEEVIMQKNLANQAELKQLQAQINPHFLYNSFFSLRNKIKRDELVQAERLASHLSTYFKFVTRNDESNVPLKNEVEHARSYTSIQQMRFYDRIKVNFEELPVQFEEILVPRLILQPIIENALEHSLEDKQENGVLNITFLVKENILEVHIEDNGKPLTDSQIADLQRKLEHTDVITGLINIHRRLKLYCGEAGGIKIQRSLIGGLEVIVMIDTDCI
ncbi:MAG TPA: sensor histidine kinase [Candidatus Pelethocola excrementipullorum]|nr:sensor histidine kinase [Candidatus Pelethocola excrementipullorum]